MADVDLTSAGKALSDFADGPVANAAKTIESALSRSFSVLERSAAKAAVSGKLSIKDMVDAMVRDFERIAVRELVVQPIASVTSSLLSSLMPVAGARADGGVVGAGQAYLVGERGPELFVPASSGRIAPDLANAAARTQVALNVTAQDAASFLRSESQIAAMLVRALKRGRRNL